MIAYSIGRVIGGIIGIVLLCWLVGKVTNKITTYFCEKQKSEKTYREDKRP